MRWSASFGDPERTGRGLKGRAKGDRVLGVFDGEDGLDR